MKTTKQLLPHLSAVMAALVVLALPAHDAHAQSTWNAGSNGNWSDGANWLGGSGPSPAGGNSTYALTFNSPTNSVSTINTGNFTLNSLILNNTTNGTSITSNGSTRLIFVDNGLTGPTIHNTGNITTVGANIDITGVTLTLSSSNNNTITLGANNRTITGAGGSIVIQSGGYSLATATTNSTFDGGVTLKAGNGTLMFAASSVGPVGALTGGPLGTGTLTLEGGTVRRIAGPLSGVLTVNNQVDIAGNVAFGLGNAGYGYIFGGNTTLTGDTIRTLTVTGNATTVTPVVLAGNITGSGSNSGLTKAGTATLVVSGTNTYLGATTVSAGALLINGDNSAATGAVSVAAGATLGGNGTIGGATTVSGNLNPGNNGSQIDGFNTSNSTGVLSFSNGLTLSSIATVNIGINGTTAGLFDRLLVTGALAFDGTLNLTTGYAAAFGDSVDLFNWTSTSGNFSSITGTSLGGGLSWDTSNLYTTGVITVVPEPTTWALLAGSLTALTILRRRRRG